MSARIFILDTSLVTRVITGSPPATAERARSLLDEAAATGMLLRLPMTVVAEVFFVLTSYYELSKPNAAELLGRFADHPAVVVDQRDLMSSTFALIIKYNQKFVDCLLIAQARQDQQGIATQDKGIIKIADVPILTAET